MRSQLQHDLNAFAAAGSTTKGYIFAVASTSTIESAEPRLNLHEAGRQAALLIWDDDEAALSIDDPRDPDFSAGVMTGLSLAIAQAPGLMRKVVRHAAAAAEDLNVEAFQGIVEVLQNADDLGVIWPPFHRTGSSGCRNQCAMFAR